MIGRFYDWAMKPLEVTSLGRLRSELLSQARGRTLEIGVGTGLNLPHYPAAIEWTGIEPDPQMRERIGRSRSRQGRFPQTLLEGDAENLEFKDDEFDTVVGTLVFCTIPHPEKALREAARVLKPGGRLLLLEHVRKNSLVTGRALDLATPVWKHLAGGCHLNRNPGEWFDLAGLRVLEEKTFWRGLGRVWVLEKRT